MLHSLRSNTTTNFRPAARAYSQRYHLLLTRTRLVDSLICITCSLGNNAFSLLYYIMVALHSSMLDRDSRFFLPLKQSRTALLDCCLDFRSYLKANRPNHFLFLLKVLLPSKFIAKSISELLKRPLKQPGQV